MGMDFTLVDPWVRIIAIIMGLASCFYGYPLFRIFLVLSGLFYGFLYGQSFYPASHPLMAILIGIVAAVVLAVLAYPLWSIGVIAVGAALGFMIAGELGLVLNLPEMGVIGLGFLGAAVLGFLFYRARDLFVMVATAYNGAVQVVYGLGLFHGALAIGHGRANALAVLAMVILGSLGFALQYGMFKDQRQYAV
jgi:hypothetical protein